MWVTFVIAGAFFVAFIAVGYFGMKQREQEASRVLTGPDGATLGATSGRELTSDEVVLQLEHRIDEEIREISYDLRAPERYGRAFQG